ncbi:hypothetical protein NDU88_001946 [Pleurodeles waltl]|uniref:Uncharacterized protein n=1 Tax=Pleurodeles waltl TaxID=8319 RepID=A0AAV7U9D0_PLEWA|nr:hypothetical protein NDU88_001946 [Pleurodeles waltl]
MGTTQPGCNLNYKPGGTTQGAAKQSRRPGTALWGERDLAATTSANTLSSKRAGSQGQPAGTQPGCTVGDVTRVEQQNSNRAQPNRGDTTLATAIEGSEATQLNMQNHRGN